MQAEGAHVLSSPANIDINSSLQTELETQLPYLCHTFIFR